jgi:hypothetical protein
LNATGPAPAQYAAGQLPPAFGVRIAPIQKLVGEQAGTAPVELAAPEL